MSFKTEPKRTFGLDIIRALAIILVVLGHGAFILQGTVLEGFPYLRMIDGVDLFFVLSGFLIGRILLREITKSPNFRLARLLSFWKRRWFRTLPNYYLVLILNLLFVKYGIIEGDLDHFNLGFLFFTQNFASPFYGFFWESWSLSIEEWFYLISPFLIFVLSRKFSPKRTFLISTLIMIVLPFVYRIYLFDDSMDGFWWDVTFRKTVLCRLDSIGYGLLSAWIYVYFRGLWRSIKIPSFLFGILLMVFILNLESGPETFYKQVIYFSLLPIAVMLILPLAASYQSSKGLFACTIVHISKVSYSMYLINLALVAEVIKHHFSPSGGADGILKYFIYWAIVLSASTLLYRFYEKPIMDLRDRKFRV